MRIESFEWDDENLGHIARHGVSADEVEEILSRRMLIERTYSGRYLVLGRSDAGRYLAVVIARKERGLVRVVTARDMDWTEYRRYWRKA